LIPLFKTEPVAQVEDNKIMFELTNETRDIKVNEAVQFVPVTELTEMELSNILLNTWIQNQISWRSQLLKLRNCCAS
jgi:cell division protein FtsZ